VSLNGTIAAGREAERVTALLDRVRKLAGLSGGARVTSLNNFPTAAGLASSASGFAALAVAASHAAGLPLSARALSSLARQSSASAGRSLFSCFAELLADTEEASPLNAPEPSQWAMLVLVVEAGKKPMSSTLGMNHTKETSPYYPAWVQQAPALFLETKQALLSSDFERLADAMEHSTRLMHATMLTSRPPIVYLRGTTVELIHEISARRSLGYPEAYTMDAGPNVKLLTRAEHAKNAKDFYEGFAGVSKVITCYPGPGAALLASSGELRAAKREEELK
jgi:diphosphomevalonate decarboxylase